MTVRRAASIWMLGGLLALIAPVRPSIGGSLAISIEVPPGSIYVGQAITVNVSTSGSDTDPEILTPDSPLATILRLDPKPQSDGASKSLVRFVLIPRRAGTIEIPPFRVRSGEKTAASRALRLTVSSIPAAGRTSAFLGGVGKFEVASEVDRSKIRAGQTVEFTIRVAGDGSWGTTRGPDLTGWSKPLGIRVEVLADEKFEPGVPSRSFRYRIRPNRAGKLTLPPLSIAAFDPASRRYVTKMSASIPISVEESARFDPSTFAYGDPTPAGRQSARYVNWQASAAAVGLVLALGGATGWFVARSRARRRAEVRALLESIASQLDSTLDAASIAELVTRGIAQILLKLESRPLGVLTPPEARASLTRLTGHEAIGDRAGRLVARCDRVLYGKWSEDPSSLVAEARELLGEIGSGLVARGRPGVRAAGGSRDRID